MKNINVLAAGVLLLGGAGAVAAPVTYTDAGGDQVGSSNKARDIRSATIDDDATNLYITVNLDPGADLSTTNNFNYTICMTTGVGANGDTSANATTHGNPYTRTFSFNSSVGGMTDFIGVFGASTSGTTYGSVGFNDSTWSPTTGTWTKNDTVASGQTIGSQAATATHNTFSIVVPKADFANMNFATGTTIGFDIFSTGTSAGQTAYDSLIDQSPTNSSNSATVQYDATTIGSYVVQNATPEPASLGLLGLAGFAMRRRVRA